MRSIQRSILVALSVVLTCFADGFTQTITQLQDWDGFVSKHGEFLKVRWDSQRNTPKRIYGQPISIGIQKVEDEESVKDAVLQFIVANKKLLGVKPDDLVLNSVTRLENPLDWYLTYVQHYKGVRVIGGYVGLNLNHNGNIVFLSSGFCPDIDMDVVPSISEEKALKIGEKASGMDGVIMEGADLGILHEADEEESSYRLVWKVTVSNGPQVDRTTVDALSGQILRKAYDTSPKALQYVYGKVWPENPTDTSLQSKGIQELYVPFSSEDTLTTAADGLYLDSSIPGDATVDDAKLHESGGSGGGAKVVIDRGFITGWDEVSHSGEDRTWTWGATSVEEQVQLNLWYQTYRMYNWFSGPPTAHFHHKMRVYPHPTLSSSGMCSSFHPAHQPRIYIRADPSVSYKHAKDSDVIQHEYSHSVILEVFTSTIEESGSYETRHGIAGDDDYHQGEAMDEGFADFFAAAENNESSLFEYCRNDWDINDDKEWPADYDSTGDEHDNGRIISGAAWDLRSQVGNSIGTNLIYRTIILMNVGGGLDDHHTFQEFHDLLYSKDDALYGDGTWNPPSNTSPHAQAIWDNFYENASEVTTHGIEPSVLTSRPSSESQQKMVVEAMQVPSEFSLSQNIPNPFNPETMIQFTLPDEHRACLTIYNISGQQIVTLLDEQMPRGRHSVVWNSKDATDKDVASGVYFYQLTAGDFRAIRKMLLIR